MIEAALKELETTLQTRGLRLQRHSGRVQLTTPRNCGHDRKVPRLEETTHLSRAALETLAIIAYQQPVTHPQIDSIAASTRTAC